MTPGTAASLARQAANPRPAPIPRRTLEQSVQDETLKSELNEINKQKAMSEPGSDTYKEMEQRAAEIEKKRLAILQPPAPTTKTGTSQSRSRKAKKSGTKRMARFTSSRMAYRFLRTSLTNLNFRPKPRFTTAIWDTPINA